MTDERFLNHQAGSDHPERPARLTAVWNGLSAAGLDDALVYKPALLADTEALLAVHPPSHLERIEAIDEAGGGRIDPDTVLGSKSWTTARLAAGAGLVAVEGLRNSEADLAFCVVRPPGHHATRERSMGFCILNNVAVTAAALIAGGERVAIVDIDAHHGNGTQDVFYDDDRVLFVSCHQWPLYPGTGAANEIGSGLGIGATINVPVPPGTSGDDYRYILDALIVPVIERHAPDWLLLSAGFDAHRSDPLTNLGLASGDFADVITTLTRLMPVGRTAMFLEGGYDLEALADSAGSSVAAVLDVVYRPECASGSSWSEASRVIDDLVRLHDVD